LLTGFFNPNQVAFGIETGGTNRVAAKPLTQHAAGDGKHAATGEFRTNPAALKAAEKAKARAREAKSWVDEKLTQSKTMREGLEGLSERSREQVIARRPSGRSKRHLRCREEPPPRKQTHGSSKIGS
jgi:hypothetical protein